MDAVRYVHAADLHLDVAFKGAVSQFEDVSRSGRQLWEATFTALERLVRLCERERPDFVVLAGDIYNEEDHSLRAQFALRDACKRLGRYEEALSYWDKALEINPTFHDAKYSKIFYYEEMGDYETAYRIRREIIDDLKQDGYDVEAAADEKLAQACFEKIS